MTKKSKFLNNMYLHNNNDCFEAMESGDQATNFITHTEFEKSQFVSLDWHKNKTEKI
jgi:hypothetical protein